MHGSQRSRQKVSAADTEARCAVCAAALHARILRGWLVCCLHHAAGARVIVLTTWLGVERPVHEIVSAAVCVCVCVYVMRQLRCLFSTLLARCAHVPRRLSHRASIPWLMLSLMTCLSALRYRRPHGARSAAG